MTTRQQRWVLAVICTCVVVISLDQLILNVALPTLVRDLHATTSELQWIVDAYILALAGFLLTGGALGDRFGRARILRIGLLVFGIASGVAAWSSNATALTACRAVMGTGAAMIMPTSLSIVANVFTEPRARSRAFATWAAVAGVGLSLGPIAGGLLLSRFWWGSVFLVNVPIILAALAVGWWAIPESRDPSVARFDPLGFVLSIVGVSGFVWTLIQAPERGWGSFATIASFVAATAVLVGLVVWELRCDHPMIEFRFFHNPRFSVANLAMVAMNFSFTGTLFALTQLFQLVYGYSPGEAGVRLAPLAAVFMATAAYSPRAAERMGTKRAVALGLGLMALGVGVLTTVTEFSTYGHVVLAMLGLGIGCGLVQAPSTEAVMGSIPKEKAGIASGTHGTTRQIGSAFGVAILGSLLVSGYQSALTERSAGLGLSTRTLNAARDSLGSALREAQRLGGSAGRSLSGAARDAFVHGMHLGVIAVIVVLLIGAGLALAYLPDHAGATTDLSDPVLDSGLLESELHVVDLVLE